MLKKKLGGMTFFYSPNLVKHEGLFHAVSTRHGGVSTGYYRSLNLSFQVGDDQERVLANYQLVSRALGFDLSSLITCQQVHDNVLTMVDKGYLQKNCFLPENTIPETDGLVTDVPGIILMTRYADCVPLIFYSPKRQTVAIAHAGWQGTLAQIGRKTIEILVREYKCLERDIMVAIGPSIGPCCYYINSTMAGRAEQELEGGKKHIKESKNGTLSFNLWQANAEQLQKAGIPGDNLHNATLCTSCHVDHFFSYRKEKKLTGRFGVFIGIEAR